MESSHLTQGKWSLNLETTTLEFKKFQISTDISLTTVFAAVERAGRLAIQGKDNAEIPCAGLMATWDQCKGRPVLKKTVYTKLVPSDVVTLKHLKNITDQMISFHFGKTPQSFYDIYNSSLFDSFLLNIIKYFHFYFKREALLKRFQSNYVPPNYYVYKIEADAKLEMCRKLVGQTYSSIILGLNFEQQHHMECGKARVSATHKDRRNFERLYVFCMYLLKLSFSYANENLIIREVNCLLRSKNFSLKVDFGKKETEGSSLGLNSAKVDVPIEYWKAERQMKRPAINTLINQRSPALISVIPEPQEISAWLFSKRYLESVERNVMESKLFYDKIKEIENCPEILDEKCGILGEPLNKFTVGLLPLPEEAEEQEEMIPNE